MAIFVVMGVSGCGKTTVGMALAEKLGCPFYDGDDFHPPENVAKMASGTPLNVSDRHPWLVRLHDLLAEHVARGKRPFSPALPSRKSIAISYKSTTRPALSFYMGVLILSGSECRRGKIIT